MWLRKLFTSEPKPNKLLLFIRKHFDHREDWVLGESTLECWLCLDIHNPDNYKVRFTEL